MVKLVDFAQIKPVPLPPWFDVRHFDATHDGSPRDDFMVGTSGNDTMYGDGGFDYISAGEGHDRIYAGPNDGNWFGSGTEVGRATVLNAGGGNDLVSISGGPGGAFHVFTGNGQDTVRVWDAEYVKIDNIDDPDAPGQGDVFNFKSNFSGDADIFGFDSNDVLDLDGGGWAYHGQVDGNAVFANAADGATVKLMGYTPQVDDVWGL